MAICIARITRTNYSKNKVGLDTLGGCGYIEYSADSAMHLWPLCDNQPEWQRIFRRTRVRPSKRVASTGDERHPPLS